jgi:triosephosphate isomerase
VRLPLDDLDAKKIEQLRKVLATIPAKNRSKQVVSAKKPVTNIGTKKPAASKRMR